MFGSAWRVYSNLLERRPLVTKSVTSGVTYALGDLLAQVIEHRSEAPRRPAFSLDWTRASIFFVYGTMVAGPLYHVWFARLDKLPIMMFQLRQHRARSDIMRAWRTLQRHGIKVELSMDKLPLARPFSKAMERGAKIVADQLVFSSLYTVVFFTCIGTATGAVDRWRARAAVLALEERVRRADADARAAGEGAGGAAAKAAAAATRAQLEEERVRAGALSWTRIGSDTLAHTRSAFWETYLLDCVSGSGRRWG